MGYYSYVWGDIEIPLDKVDEVMAEIDSRKEKARQTYIDWHIADTIVTSNEDGDKAFIQPPEDDQKWYGFNEYVAWLNKYAIEGEIRRDGEESDDFEAYKWEKGEMYELIIVETWKRLVKE